MPQANQTGNGSTPPRARPATTMQRVRAWNGPAVLSYGFRPFFLLGGAYAAIALIVWLTVLTGRATLPGPWPPLAWHAHELVFGFVPAVMAGFLLTAVPNWTGQMPVVGWPLAGLVAVWAAGRLAVAAAGVLPWGAVAVIAVAFPVALAAVLGREILRGHNWHNLPVLGAVLALAVAQGLFHAELLIVGAPIRGDRMALVIAVFLVTLIGGRIIPSFTTNWLKRRDYGPLPAAYGRVDVAAVGLGGIALLFWAGLPLPPLMTAAAGVVLVASGALHLLRQTRWQPWRTGAEALVWVLHLAYLFVPVGFLLTGAGVLLDDYGFEMAGLHAWTIGAIGLLTLAVMTRATRGHTGRTLTAPTTTTAIYMAVAAAALARIAAALVPHWSAIMLILSALGWVAGFVGFVVLYGPMLLQSRRVIPPGD
jgi:uncharacterized protein involved in response to NO